MNKLSVTPAFGVYFLYALWVWLCEGADFLAYCCDLTQCTLLSRILVSALLLGIVFLLRKQVELRSWKPDKIFWLFSAVIMGYCFLKGISPDFSHDTAKGHVLLQTPGYLRTMEECYLPASPQMFGFRLSERLFYAFRMALGYRMGTLFTGLVTLLVYAQVTELITALSGRQLPAAKAAMPRGMALLLSPAVLAFPVAFGWEVILQQGTYMVEVITLPFAIEALCLLLTGWHKPQSALEMVWYALLCGFYFACKMTHIVYLPPLILLYLWLHRKDLTVPRFLAAFLLALVPISINLLYNIMETGNPVFPYFNDLFRSPYYSTKNFKDPRWGPSGFLELLLWPVISSVYPQYRLSEVPTPYVIGTAIYLLAALATLVQCLRSRKLTTGTILLIVATGSCYLWAATTGHSRYFMLGYVFLGILTVDVLLHCMVQPRKLLRTAAILVILLLQLQPWVCMEHGSAGNEFSWRNSRSLSTITANLPYLFRDQQGTLPDAEPMPEADMILMNAHLSGPISTLFPDTMLVCNLSLQRQPDRETKEKWEAIIQTTLREGTVYDLTQPGAQSVDWKTYISTLADQNIGLKSLSWRDTVFNHSEGMALMELEPLQSHNSLLYANCAEDTLTAEASVVQFRAQITLGRAHYFYLDTPSVFTIYASDGSNTRAMYSCSLAEMEAPNLDLTLDLTDFSGEVTLSFTCTQEDGSPLRDWYECLILNPVLA